MYAFICEHIMYILWRSSFPTAACRPLYAAFKGVINSTRQVIMLNQNLFMCICVYVCIYMWTYNVYIMAKFIPHCGLSASICCFQRVINSTRQVIILKYMRIYVYISIYIHVYVYIYVFVWINIHVYLYIHIYIYLPSGHLERF
jgi:hypothetical protein